MTKERNENHPYDCPTQDVSTHVREQGCDAEKTKSSKITSPARAAANKKNAQKSTGPRTAEGKAGIWLLKMWRNRRVLAYIVEWITIQSPRRQPIGPSASVFPRPFSREHQPDLAPILSAFGLNPTLPSQ